MTKLPSRRVLPLLAALGAAALSLGMAERNARAHFPHPRVSLAFERGAYHRVLVADPPAGAAGPARVSTNWWGMRGDDPPADWAAHETWIAVGSSSTLCAYLDDARTWPARLQAALNAGDPGRRAWVGNAGEDGLTSAALAGLAEKVVGTVRPRGLIVLPGGPDMIQNFSDDRRERPNPYDAAFARRLARLDGEPGLADRVGLWRAWREWRRARADGPWVPDRSGHAAWNPPPLMVPEDSLPPMDRLLPFLPAYRDNLRKLAATARAQGVRAVFLTHPTAFGTDGEWRLREARILRIEGCEYRISAATERRLRDLYNAALLEVCGAESLECLDLAALIPPEAGYYYDGSHFNDRGAALVGRLIADHLLKTHENPRI